MDHGGEPARPTTVGFTDLGMAGAVQAGEANMSTATFHGDAAAARRASFQPTAGAWHNPAEFARLVRAASGPAGVVYANIIGAGASLQQPGGRLDAVLVGPQLPDGVVQVLVDLLPVPDGAGHGEVFVDLLPGDGGGAVHDNYDYYYPWQHHRGAGRDEVFIGPLLPDGVSVEFDGSGNFARQTLPVPGTRGAGDGIAGALRLRGPNLGEGYGSRGVVAEHLRHLLPFAGIATCSLAVNGLAAGPGSAAVAFHLFALLLGGLFLVILHVLRV